MAHWYKPDGTPAYTVIGTNGIERDTTLRDAKKLKLDVSVTTILGILDKPYLNQVWFPDQILEAVIRSEWSPNYDDTDQVSKWKQQVLYDAKTISRTSSARGSEIHDKLEQYYSGAKHIGEFGDDTPIIRASIDKIDSILKSKTWVAEQAFSHKLGFGGKIDLNSPKGAGFIVDFKTKAEKSDFTKDQAYPEHVLQLAAYRIGLALPIAKCYNLFIKTVKPNVFNPETDLQLKEWSQEEIAKAEEMFKLLLRFWQLSTGHDSRRL